MSRSFDPRALAAGKNLKRATDDLKAGPQRLSVAKKGIPRPWTNQDQLNPAIAPPGVKGQLTPAGREGFLSPQFPFVSDGIYGTFPINQFHHPSDDWFALKSKVVSGEGMVPGVGVALADEAYFEYAQRKRELEFMSEFYKYLYTQIDFSTPEKREYWEHLFPQFTEQVYQGWEIWENVRNKIAAINIRGIQNEEDLLFKWMVEKGFIRSMFEGEDGADPRLPFRFGEPAFIRTYTAPAAEGTNFDTYMGQDLGKLPPVLRSSQGGTRYT
jgi:hypothetical protein